VLAAATSIEQGCICRSAGMPLEEIFWGTDKNLTAQFTSVQLQARVASQPRVSSSGTVHALFLPAQHRGQRRDGSYDRSRRGGVAGPCMTTGSGSPHRAAVRQPEVSRGETLLWMATGNRGRLSSTKKKALCYAVASPTTRPLRSPPCTIGMLSWEGTGSQLR